MAKKMTRKCDYCNIDDTNKEDMIVIKKTSKDGKKNTYKYYHNTCHPKFLKRQAFREREQDELDELCKVIMGIYGVKSLPNSVFPLLQDLRNGNKFFGKRDYKYKKGYSYTLIAETFDYVSNSIEWANANKNFNGFNQAFRYGLAIVCDKLMIVESQKREKLAKEAISERKKEAQDLNNEKLDFAEVKKEKKDEMDISDLLD